MNRFISQRRYWPLSVLLWGVLVWFLFTGSEQVYADRVLELARERSEFVTRLVKATRMWAARHGGVYAPTTESNPPNRWLDPDIRQAMTTEGVELTLINPSYMTRQLGKVVSEYNDLSLHLTSLDPINPANLADEWETAQLLQMKTQSKSKAHSEQLVYREGEPIFRYLVPLYLDKACQQCHTRSTDTLGSLRGAISIEFPAAPLFAQKTAQLQEVARTYVLIWVLLSGLTLVALVRLRSQLNRLDNACAQTEQQVRERTAELATKVEEHQQAAAQLKLFIDSSGEGIMAMDMHGRCTLVNPRALQLLGVEDENQLLGQSLHEQVHHSGKDGNRHEASTCLMHGTITTGEQIHQDDDVFWRADGTSFAVEYRSHPLYADGKLIGAVINFSDISQRKIHEQQLKKLSSAMEHSPSIAVITDANGLIEYVNPRFVKTTGYTKEEVIGQNPRILQSGRTTHATYQDMWNQLRAGKVWAGELLNKKKDGTLYWEHVRISPITSDAGNISHFIAIKEDVTERKTQEQEIWKQANFDALTGLPNRSMMQAALDKALEQADECGQIAAVLYMDLDGFKQVNDSLGHAAGDQVLIEAAQRVQQVIRSTDTVARLGGDEFVVILEHLEGAAPAGLVASKIVDRVGRSYRIDGRCWDGISASVGLALYPADGDTAEQLLSSADQAMYRAKQAGRWAGPESMEAE